MYKLPSTLGDDIRYIGNIISDFKANNIPAGQFKAVRVPMGLYEQRENGTYMLRIRCSGGFIRPEQLAKVCEVGDQFKASHIHITSRQEIQLHFLPLDDAPAAMEALSTVELGTKGGGGNTIRNMLVDIEAGINEAEVFDPYPYAVALTNRLIAENDSFTMPRKLKIAFAISEEKAGYALINDLGFIPKIQDGKKGFKVYLGGSVASNPHTGWLLFDFVEEKNIVRVAEAAKRFFSANGNRKNKHKARIRHIFYKLGEEETVKLFKQYYDEALNDASLDLELPNLDFKYTVPTTPALKDKSLAFKLWKARYTNEQKQDGLFSLIIPFSHGNAPTKVFASIAQFASQFGNNVLRFTTRQNLQLRNIPEAYLANVYALLKELEFDIDHPFLANNIISCTGADTCRLGICFSKGLQEAIRKRLLASNLDLDVLNEVQINISGCTNSCGQQIWSDLGFSGRVIRNGNIAPAYTVYLKTKGDKELSEPVGAIAAYKAPEFAEDLLRRYLAVKNNYTSFGEWAKAEGADYARQALKNSDNIPSFEEDKNYYFDWGAKEVFSYASRGQAECSAGLFDMIDLDKSAIEEGYKELETAADEKKEALLAKIVFSAARMLLITRGEEPRTSEQVFYLFSKLFIEQNLVDAKYQYVINKAKLSQPLKGSEADIKGLSDAVIALYSTMDDSLQFKVPAGASQAAPAPSEAPAVKEEKKEEAAPVAENVTVKDLRGVACPMNFVKTKMALANLQKGDLLEVWLDDGQPIANVPGSVRNEGHNVLKTDQTADGYWKVLIEKQG